MCHCFSPFVRLPMTTSSWLSASSTSQNSSFVLPIVTYLGMSLQGRCGERALEQRFLELLDHGLQRLALRLVEIEHDAHAGRLLVGGEDRVRDLADERERLRLA